MNKRPPLRNDEIAELLHQGSWPHLPGGKIWKKSADSLRHVSRAVKKLDELGLPPNEAAEMIRQLYWCAYGDIQDMPKSPPRERSGKNPMRYFDEFGIMFSLCATNLKPEELKCDYEFYCNLYAKDGNIWWATSGSSASGGPVHDFLNEVRSDNNFAFGPTKPQRGRSAEDLAKLNAVGVYKLKEPLVKLVRARAAKAPSRAARKRK